MQESYFRKDDDIRIAFPMRRWRNFQTGLKQSLMLR
jgi:hypothetical protein